MGLTNRQFDEIKAIYDERVRSNRRLVDERIAKLKEKIPAYAEIENEIGDLRSERIRLRINAESEEELKKQTDLLIKKREEILTENGYPKDYDKPIYDCKICHDTGFIESERKRCSCFKKERTALLFRESGLQDIIDEQDFSKLSLEFFEGEDLKAYENAVRISREYAKDFGNDGFYGNLLFYGSVGTGKTFLSCCIAKDVMERGFSVAYLSADSMFKSLVDLRFDEDRQAYKNIREDLEESDLLIIDDLGTEVSSERSEADFFSILTERDLRKKGTVISTNLQLKELSDRYSERVFSRVSNGFTICRFSGKDIRLMKKLKTAGSRI